MARRFRDFVVVEVLNGNEQKSATFAPTPPVHVRLVAIVISGGVNKQCGITNGYDTGLV